MAICQIMKRPAFAFIFSILILSSAVSQVSSKKVIVPAEEKTEIVWNETFEQAKELFGLNKPDEAIPLFESLLEEKNIDPALYIYLGVSYYQTGDFPKSYSICTKGLALPGTDHKILAFNAGNSAYALGNYARADACYAIAMKEDKDFAPAYLNRANAQLKQDHLQDAKTNYEKFLQISPEDEQAEKITYLIKLLEEEIVRRANQKPEIIDPDDFVENKNDEIPVVPEKIDYENPDTVTEPEEEVFAELIGDDAVAPELPADERQLPQELPFEEAVTQETLPPEKDEVKKPVIQEEAVNETAPDFVEPAVEENLESVEDEDKKAPDYSDAK